MKYQRITKHGETQIRKGHKWVKLKTSQINPVKLKRWRELQQKRKEEKR